MKLVASVREIETKKSDRGEKNKMKEQLGRTIVREEDVDNVRDRVIINLKLLAPVGERERWKRATSREKKSSRPAGGQKVSGREESD